MEGYMKNAVFASLCLPLIVAAFLVAHQSSGTTPGLTPREELGKRLFFDKALSRPAGQDCGACHHPSVGWTGPDQEDNAQAGVYEGAVTGRFGNRKPPASCYVGGSPVFHQAEKGYFLGGMFSDGRATGETLGDALAEQAVGPFLNQLEQNMADEKAVILAVKKSDYAGLFEKVWGVGSLDAEKDVDGTYARIGHSIAAFERSAEVNPFNSRFDDFWRAAQKKGLAVQSIREDNRENYAGLGLGDEELLGLALFNTKGNCSRCHTMASQGGQPPVFTDYRYDNLGVPRNPRNPFYRQPKTFNTEGEAWIDKGLGGFLETHPKYKAFAAANYGKHKVPTLRNVNKRPSPDFLKAYLHNGYFTSLKELVHFYNTRDKAGSQWPAPEVSENVNKSAVGNLGLTDAEEDAIILFLKTLSDRD
jgi:cytochrome c peroxidase